MDVSGCVVCLKGHVSRDISIVRKGDWGAGWRPDGVRAPALKSILAGKGRARDGTARARPRVRRWGTRGKLQTGQSRCPRLLNRQDVNRLVGAQTPRADGEDRRTSSSPSGRPGDQAPVPRVGLCSMAIMGCWLSDRVSHIAIWRDVVDFPMRPPGRQTGPDRTSSSTPGRHPSARAGCRQRTPPVCTTGIRAVTRATDSTLAERGGPVCFAPSYPGWSTRCSWGAGPGLMRHRRHTPRSGTPTVSVGIGPHHNLRYRLRCTRAPRNSGRHRNRIRLQAGSR
jgi:hypothetical protein